MASFNNPKVTNAINSDVAEIQKLLTIVAKQDYTGATNIPAGAKRLAAVSGGIQLQKYQDSSWVTVGKLMHSVDQLDGYHASTSAVKNTIPVYNAAAQLVGSITGNAATATKLASSRTIDIGGIASADAVAFNGTKGITIPINSINVANDDDTALVGIVSKAHGGTGRNDGAASDVILANGGKASEYGQIGDAKGIDGKDLNSIVNSGVYMGTKATTANHFPRGTSVSYLLYVARLNTQIRQTLIMRDTEIWTRRSADSGASWEAWHSVGYSSNDTITIYISKSGSDENTGLETAYPLLTIDRALELAKQIYNPRSGKSVNFRVGEGSWGNVTFKSLPYYLFITAYDGNNSTEFSESLPHFGILSAEHSMVALGSVVCDYLDSNLGSTIYVTEKYYRGSTIRARHGGLCLFNGSSSDPILDIVARSSHDYVFLAYNFGYIAFGSSRKVTVTGNLTLSQAFLCLNTGSFMSSNGAQFSMSSGVKVTGKKYALYYGTSVAFRNSERGVDTYAAISRRFSLNRRRNRPRRYRSQSGTHFFARRPRRRAVVNRRFLYPRPSRNAVHSAYSLSACKRRSRSVRNNGSARSACVLSVHADGLRNTLSRALRTAHFPRPQRRNYESGNLRNGLPSLLSALYAEPHKIAKGALER